MHPVIFLLGQSEWLLVKPLLFLPAVDEYEVPFFTNV